MADYKCLSDEHHVDNDDADGLYVRHSTPCHATTSKRNGLRFSSSKIRLLNELLIGKMKTEK